ERTVVAPGREVRGLTIGLDSPRGIALIGMRVGEEHAVTRLDGSTELIVVEAILFQPEANRRQRTEERESTLVQLVPRGMRPAGRAAPFVPPHDDDPGPAAA